MRGCVKRVDDGGSVDRGTFEGRCSPLEEEGVEVGGWVGEGVGGWVGGWVGG